MTDTKRPFRTHHLLQLLDTWPCKLPLDLWVYRYFREHKALGSKDRAEISNLAFQIVKWQRALGRSSSSWEGKLAAYEAWQQGSPLPCTLTPAERLSLPDDLYAALVRTFGEKEAEEQALIANEEAPVTLRVNTTKITREALIERLQPTLTVEPLPTPTALKAAQRFAFGSLPEFTEGLFELQDEASQEIAALLDAYPGSSVLDYCAGSGGKTLAFAPPMLGRGQIYLHDVRAYALKEAKARLKRAGITHFQFFPVLEESRKKFHGRMDRIFVDAPCSGTGTLRRNPDMKWNFSQQKLQELIDLQRSIMKEALVFLKPRGKIVYATCSLLKEENEEQLAYFEKELGLQSVQPPYRSKPTSGGKDGFFAALLTR